jgi:hypothetical protein
MLRWSARYSSSSTRESFRDRPSFAIRLHYSFWGSGAERRLLVAYGEGGLCCARYIHKQEADRIDNNNGEGRYKKNVGFMIIHCW